MSQSAVAVDRHRLERLKAAVRAHLDDLGDLSEVDGLSEEQVDACLPSGRAWSAFVRTGDTSALGSALTHTGLRACLIGTGLLIVGADRGRIVRDAVSGSLGVDAFILL